MKIFDVKTLIYQTLDSIPELQGNIYPRYPEELTTYPLAVYSTSHVTVQRNADQEELLTSWSFTIDLFVGEGSPQEIEDKIIDVFSQMGFTYSAVDQDLNGVARVAITFYGVVDNQLQHVYQK